MAGLVGLLVVVGAGLAGADWLGDKTPSDSLQARLAEVVPISTGRPMACKDLAAARPLVLLALGQSNAGNHGERRRTSPAAVAVVAEGRCALATDPLPGGTGAGGSIWSSLPDAMAMQAMASTPRPVALSVLAVDATTVDDWTREGSPLRARLLARLGELNRLELLPSLVLWQQGEADSMRHTSAEAYATQLQRLRAVLNQAGVVAPLLAARTTVCRSPPDPAIREGVSMATRRDATILMGPDTDALSGADHRIDGCHFSALGLDAAARLWARASLDALRR
jgi:hypothetical protein